MVEYYRYNTLIKESFPFTEFDLLYAGYYSPANTGVGLVFRRNKKKFLVQYEYSIWKKGLMVELFDYVKNRRKKYYQ